MTEQIMPRETQIRPPAAGGRRARGPTWIRALLVAGLLLGAQASMALGLGDITARSYLGQPFEGRIQLLGVEEDQLGQISVSLASADSFRMVGLDRLALSVPLSFEVRGTAANAHIAVQSGTPINDPVLQFVLQVNFANGRLLKQYTVFLDPPTTRSPAPLPRISVAPQAAAPEPAAPQAVQAPAESVTGRAAVPVPEVRTEPAVPEADEPIVEPDPEPSRPAVQARSSGEAEAVLAAAPEALPETETPVEQDPVPPAEAPDSSEPAKTDPGARVGPPDTPEPAAEPSEAGERAVPGDESSEPAAPPQPDESEDPVAESDIAEAVAEPGAAEVEVPEVEPAPPEAPSDQETAPDPRPADEAETPDMPAGDEVADAIEASPDVASEDQPTQEPAAVAPSPRYAATVEDLERYGPIARGETLWGIAARLTEDTALSVNQAMLAIQRYNPDAFIRGNINLLKSGAILRLPPRGEMARLSARAAMLEAMRQAEDMQAIRAGRDPAPRPAPVLAELGPDSAVEPAEEAPDVETGEPEGRLELIPPLASETATAAGTGSDGEMDSGGALSEEERASAEQESQYLGERLRELEEELGADGGPGDASDDAGVADAGMAELEQRLREARESGAPPEPVTVAPSAEEKPYRDWSGWWLLPLILLVAVAVWWMRRSGADRSYPSPGAAAADDPAMTAQSLAAEAEEIARTLEAEADERPKSLSPSDTDEPSEPETPQSADGVDADPSPSTTRSRPQESEEAVELDADDPETKLDLARAYIAMGDGSAARRLLDEVIAEGNEEQAAEAAAMKKET